MTPISLAVLAIAAVPVPDVIDVFPSGNVHQLRDVVSAATDGDVIRVHGGAHHSVLIHNKSLTILAVAPGVSFHRLSVVGLGPDQAAVVAGSGTATTPALGSAIELSGCAGTVHLSHIDVTGSGSFGAPSLLVNNCSDVVLHRMNVTNFVDCGYYALPCLGMNPLAIYSSRVFITESAVIGSDGLGGGPGGHGLLVQNSEVFLEDCRVLGGCGGWVSSSNPYPLHCTGNLAFILGGFGGDGIRCENNVRLHLIECEVRAGAHVPHPAGVCTNLLAQDIRTRFDTVVDLGSRFGVSLSMPNLAVEGTGVTVEVEGTPGHTLLLLVGAEPTSLSLPGVEGPLAVTGRSLGTGRFLLGPSPASSVWTAPDLAPGATHTLWFQPLQIRPGKTVLGSVVPITIIDSIW